MKTIEEEIAELWVSVCAGLDDGNYKAEFIEKITQFFALPRTLSANDCVKVLRFHREVAKYQGLTSLTARRVKLALGTTVTTSRPLFDGDAEKFEVEREINITWMGQDAEILADDFPELFKAEPYTSLPDVERDIKLVEKITGDIQDNQIRLAIWFNLRVKPMKYMLVGMTNEKLSLLIDVISAALGGVESGQPKNYAVQKEWLGMRRDLIEAFPFLHLSGVCKDSEETSLKEKYREGGLALGD